MKDAFSQNKILVVGLDGATNNLIESLLAKNKLPFFQKLKQNGLFGELKAPLPINSASSWASFFTGKNPGKHNIYDYLSHKNTPNSPSLISRQSIKAKTIWNITESYPIKSIYFNVPILTEPQPLNGYMASGFITPKDKPYAYPDTFQDELSRQNYQPDCGPNGYSDLEQHFNKLIEGFENQATIFQNKIKSFSWNIAFASFNVLDRVQKLYWDDADKIEQIYSIIDQRLGEIFSTVGKDTYLFVFSTHGYSSVNRKFFVNEWLHENNFLKYNISTNKTMITDADELVFNHEKDDSSLITDILTKYGITKNNIRSILPESVNDVLKKAVPQPLKKLFHKEYLEIEWKKTRAYFISENIQGININLKGREFNGIVEPGFEYENLREQIISELYNLKDPYSFENVIDDAYKKEDIFHGKNLEDAPDIIIVSHKNRYVLDPNKRTAKLVIGSANDDSPVSAQRDRNGILFLNGPGVSQNSNNVDIHITDLMPTILALLGIDYVDNLDGKVISQISGAVVNEVNEQQDFIPAEDITSFIPEEFFNNKIKSGNIPV